MPTHYEVLNITEDADPAVVKASYKALAHRFHPDRTPNSPKAAVNKFHQISEAYDVLSNPGSRRAYDEQLRMERSIHATHSAGLSTKATPPGSSAPHTSPVRGSWLQSSELGSFLQSAAINWIRKLTAGAAEHALTPAWLKWMLRRPLLLILLGQLCVAVYVFRDALPFG